jgi:hypothetical protein
MSSIIEGPSGDFELDVVGLAEGPSDVFELDITDGVYEGLTASASELFFATPDSLGSRTLVFSRTPAASTAVAGTLLTSASWVVISPQEHVVGDDLHLDVVPAVRGLPTGTYSATITFKPDDPLIQPVVVAVQLIIDNRPSVHQDFAPVTALQDFIVGPHNVFDWGGITLNDRRFMECFWTDDLTGFGATDVIVGADENTYGAGELPQPGRHGGRTMTLTGYIQCGHYVTAQQMERMLLNTCVSLNERKLIIRPLWHHQAQIYYCLTCVQRPDFSIGSGALLHLQAHSPLGHGTRL